MLDPSTLRTTALREPSHEAHVEQDLSRAATGIASELGDALSALWLVGPFARGEGGMVSDRGELTAYPGYELIAVLRRKPARHDAALRSLGGAWSRLLGTRVSIAGIGARSISHLPPTRFWLEAQSALRTLSGDVELARQIPERSAAELPNAEASATVAAAFTALALGELEQASARAKTERLHAAATALGDSLLLRRGQLPPTWRERAAELGRVRDASEVAPLYRDALAFFARPDRWTPVGVNVSTWLDQARRALCHAYLAHEAARVRSPMHVFGYLRHPDPIANGSAMAKPPPQPSFARRARLLAMRVPALAALAVDPFDRLLRASVALAFAADAPACRTHVAAFLGLRTAFGAAGDDELAKALRSLACDLLEDPLGAPFARLSFDPP